VEKGIPHDEFLDWDPSSRAKALAWLMEHGTQCALCGTAPWEWKENRFAYDVEEVFCEGCYRKEISSRDNQDRLPGTRIELVPVTQALRDKQQQAYQRRARLDLRRTEADE